MDSYHQADHSCTNAVIPRSRIPPNYLQGVIKDLMTPWPDNRLINIVCHGHSVPAGYFTTPEVRTFDSYPHLLHAALKERYPYAVANVIVTAEGGEDSERGAARFDEVVLRHRPDVITIDYGLNDRNIGLQRAELAWRRMIESALANGIAVIVLTPTPDLDADYNDPNDAVNQHAQQIRALAQQYPVALADSQNAFRWYCAQGGRLEDLMAQARHPNRAGHQLVADILSAWFVAGSS